MSVPPALVARPGPYTLGRPLLTVVVYGRPAPQGSKRHVGGGRLIEQVKGVKPWRDDVKAATEAVLRAEPGWLLNWPLAVDITFTLPKPASAPKRSRTWPMRTPDLDKLVRSTFDALTSAGAWADDARVVELVARKAYPGEHADALDRPGAVIVITEVIDQ